jgi:PAS domain S-box-containing protein
VCSSDLSQERNRIILKTAMDGFWLADTEGRLIEVNESYCRMSGYSESELLTMFIHDLEVTETADDILNHNRKIMATGEDRFESRHRRKDGSIMDVEVSVQYRATEGGRFVAFFRDITERNKDIAERKQAEAELQKSEEQAQQLAQENAIMAEIGKIISSTLNIDEVYDRFAGEVRKLIPFDRININIVNPEDKMVTVAYGTGTVVSDRQPGDVFSLAGTVLEEIIRTHSGVLVQTDNVTDLAERFPGLLPHFRTGQRSMLSIPLISKDRVIGSLFLGSARLNAYTNRDVELAESIAAQIAGAIANAQLFIERQRLEERLNRAEKMEALGALAGGVAHDLNNVLGVLVGYSELLLLEVKEGNPLRRHASNILQSGQRAAAIIQDLLTLARRGVAVSEVMNLNNVISDYFKTPEFEKLKAYHPLVTFKSDLDKDVMNIKGSSVHLSKTIMNLLSNAAEAITDRGEVTLVTENRYLDKPITGYDHIQEGDYVVLRVSDNGGGISAADMGKIFEPFYTKKVMGRSGTGLGLAIVWGTVKDHGGYIDVQSEEGKGSTFTLYFPVTREERVSDQKEVSPESYMGRGESILVVDDVKEQRELATAMLSGLGYRVSSVSTGEEAVAYLKANRVDLLVLDMIMDPGIDGLETYQKVLEINPRQKTIIVSGFSETDRVKKTQELGAGAYVRKPYIREKIGLAIKKELDK